MWSRHRQLDVAMSLDGFTAVPNVGEAEPMGEGGEAARVDAGAVTHLRYRVAKP
jgi:hypothetical protein